MITPYVIFDIETERIPGQLNLDRHIPGITVAATLTDQGELKLWCERDEDGQVTGRRMSPSLAGQLVAYFESKTAAGASVVTWNGAGFDYRVLAHASQLHEQCVTQSWQHIDMMFWFHCTRGFSIALSKAAEAVGSAKTAGISGADAPRLWAEGEYDQVLQYVAQDVRATEAVYLAAKRQGGIQWRTSYGRLSKASGSFVSVRESLAFPQPDTSWMSRKPWPRSKFVGWMH